MPLNALVPMERSTLAILYQFDVALTPRVAAANFTIGERDAAQVLGRLVANGYVDDLGDDLYRINDRGKDAIVTSGEFRGGQLAV